jgi:NAD-reducing hydrogenase small subunit
LDSVYDRAYKENVQLNPTRPHDGVPALLAVVKPVHAVVPVDLHVPGCPPSADTIWFVLSQLLEGRIPNPNEVTRFGA